MASAAGHDDGVAERLLSGLSACDDHLAAWMSVANPERESVQTNDCGDETEADPVAIDRRLIGAAVKSAKDGIPVLMRDARSVVRDADRLDALAQSSQ